ncbi:MAG: hypothetical protein PF487_14405 [Bacteroidales bacterium]|nr:hypothetical protein [Bacteroidales bacterium]
MNYLVGDILRINEEKSKKFERTAQNLVSIKSIKESIITVNEFNDEFHIDDLSPVKLKDISVTRIYLDLNIMAAIILPNQELPKRNKITLDKLLAQKDFLFLKDSVDIVYVHQFQKYLIEKNGKEWKLKLSFQLF